MWVIKEPCWASELHLFEFQSSRWPDVRRSCSHSYAVRNISQGVVSSLKVLISLQSLTICSHSFVKDSVRCLSIPRWNCISAIPILSFLLSPGSLRGCNLCEQLLLLVPWLRPPGGHPHPAQHSVWELVRKVQETHHPERIWSRCGGRTSQCEDSHTHTHIQLPDSSAPAIIFIFLSLHPKAVVNVWEIVIAAHFPRDMLMRDSKTLSSHSPGSTHDVYWGVSESSAEELPRCFRPEEEAVCHRRTHLELCRLHDYTRYCSCRSKQHVEPQLLSLSPSMTPVYWGFCYCYRQGCFQA